MATLTPNQSGRDRATDPGAPLGRASTAWIRSLLDRPLTSYQLIVGSVGLLLIIGMMMVLSASSVNAFIYRDDAYFYVKRQGLFLVVGLLAAMMITRLPLTVIRILGWLAVGGSMVMLTLTYTALGFEIAGNRNWLDIGVPWFRVQPAEFAKLAIVVWGADVLARKERLLDQPKHLLFPYLPVSSLLIALVVFQGDAGTAVVMLGIVAAVLWMVGAPMRIFASLGMLAVAGIVALFVTSPVRMRRLTAFLDPTADLNGANDQANAGLYAIAGGGWWGTGLGASRQKWGSLPESHTDFIFAVLGEELGLFGSLIVLGLLMVLGYAGIRVALRSDQAFGRFAAAGVTSWLMLQALINLAVVLRLIPIAGVPLPFLSYGGSALLSNLLAVGVLLACARNEPAARAVLTRTPRWPPPTMTAIVGHRASPPGGRR